MIQEGIYAFKGKTKQSHFTLDNGKSANHNDAIELDSSDLERKLIKDLINEKNPKKDRLIIIKNDTN